MCVTKERSFLAGKTGTILLFVHKVSGTYTHITDQYLNLIYNVKNNTKVVLRSTAVSEYRLAPLPGTFITKISWRRQ